MADTDEKAYRKYSRVETKSVLVSLVNTAKDQQITGFVRDISEGGLKIQKLSAKRQVELDTYDSEFTLPGLGKVAVQVEVVGFGQDEEKFGEHLIRGRFLNLDEASRIKIKTFVEEKGTL